MLRLFGMLLLAATGLAHADDAASPRWHQEGELPDIDDVIAAYDADGDGVDPKTLVEMDGVLYHASATYSEARAAIEAIYAKAAPEKVAEIPRLLQKYAGKEQTLLRAIKKKYKVEAAEVEEAV